jgi:hypothetical protein
MKTRDAYVKDLKKQLDLWNADIAKWEKQAKAAGAQARKRYEKDLEALHAEREKAMYNLRLIESASASAWSDFTAGADEAWARMRQAAASARSHFEK